MLLWRRKKCRFASCTSMKLAHMSDHQSTTSHLRWNLNPASLQHKMRPGKISLAITVGNLHRDECNGATLPIFEPHARYLCVIDLANVLTCPQDVGWSNSGNLQRFQITGHKPKLVHRQLPHLLSPDDYHQCTVLPPASGVTQIFVPANNNFQRTFEALPTCEVVFHATYTFDVVNILTNINWFCEGITHIPNCLLFPCFI